MGIAWGVVVPINRLGFGDIRSLVRVGARVQGGNREGKILIPNGTLFPAVNTSDDITTLVVKAPHSAVCSHSSFTRNINSDFKMGPTPFIRVCKNSRLQPTNEHIKRPIQTATNAEPHHHIIIPREATLCAQYHTKPQTPPRSHRLPQPSAYRLDPPISSSSKPSSSSPDYSSSP